MCVWEAVPTNDLGRRARPDAALWAAVGKAFGTAFLAARSLSSASLAGRAGVRVAFAPRRREIPRRKLSGLPQPRASDRPAEILRRIADRAESIIPGADRVLRED